MKKGLVSLSVVMITALVLSGCELVFTYSPVSFLQRDLSGLSEEQTVTRARELLESGNTADMKTAYEAVNSIVESQEAVDTELSLLAANLAFGGSGINDVIADFLTLPDWNADSISDEVDRNLENLDLDLLSSGAEHVQNVVNTGSSDVTQDQYIVTGVALVLAAAGEAGGFDQLETLTPDSDGYETLQDAVVYLELGDVLSYFAVEEDA